jgi:hypothetical protein
LTDHIDGVVMLGGGVDGGKSAVWQQIALNEAAERVTALQELARRYPVPAWWSVVGSGA